jgi:hypothetical protein
MPTLTSIAETFGGCHKSVKAIVKVEESEIGYRHRHRLRSIEDALEKGIILVTDIHSSKDRVKKKPLSG